MVEALAGVDVNEVEVIQDFYEDFDWKVEESMKGDKKKLLKLELEAAFDR